MVSVLSSHFEKSAFVVVVVLVTVIVLVGSIGLLGEFSHTCDVDLRSSS